ncbi:MAG TPA: NADH-quinone oxidoreductase subunit J [Melioribacteraceae bacterium]|nr:NADH-quinone oxidoreductase subunit J [Melioribacteraceae bacterium]
MNIELIIFVVFSLIAVISTIMVVTRKNAIMSAVFLILNFFALAGLYLLLNAQFIAVVQIIVYAGAIMVLFLFVIMLLNQHNEPSSANNKRKIKTFGVIIAALIFVQIVYIIFYQVPSHNITPDKLKSVEIGKIGTIGNLLYTEYVLPFLVAGFLLLSATIGAIVLAKKKFE